MSGTSPGFTFAGVAVSLNPDPCLLYTVQNPGGPPLSG